VATFLVNKVIYKTFSTINDYRWWGNDFLSFFSGERTGAFDCKHLLLFFNPDHHSFSSSIDDL